MAKEPEKQTGGLLPSGFGPVLRRIREEKGLTQKRVGDTAGVHPNTVAKMERSEIEPSWPMVLALAQALGVDCTAFNAAPADEQPAAEEKPAPKKKGGKK
ncbi:helix-turn-helix domain-containing protein [Frigoriglobus tundricola]|uniref:HTH cro/C1-type domain-containing protein n=1 Tax=Frigoriglobus tundricola TaxID=2774151 RepID=A0A6M5Z0X9_9BACT|nr:helix-turn-helix transcriptional regulator [Frigoriglobus tundricola]QJX00048.1 hypothetical protein FTUN_7671 [Frigoriglobus tundricola]